jgi:hypothetical protein
MKDISRPARLRLSDAQVQFLAEEFYLWKRANACLQGRSTDLKWNAADRAMKVFLSFLARGGGFHHMASHFCVTLNSRNKLTVEHFPNHSAT